MWRRLCWRVCLTCYGGAEGISLGSKLHLLNSCSSFSSEVPTVNGGQVKPITVTAHVQVAANNASAVDTVRLVENFARTLLQQKAGEGGKQAQMFDNILKTMPAFTAMAEQAARAAGVEFTPDPQETLQLIRTSFACPRVHLISFEDDDLDQNDVIGEILARRFDVSFPGKLTSEELPGNHVSPVHVKIGGDSINPALSSLGDLNLGDEGGVIKLADETMRFLKET
ncbi:hypothetical protein CYMTET_34258 [Cymbomonas tetramitiformis]|uniref:Uncharacterized protein n=1 Tax=Cymbomonas tetramitiformis TaxID=36881 RepID=A0AAE0FC08_9CHLO|nr:hypothetical protein CYMTET_34258 [Cymbomonas tetramitiformis]